MTSSAELKSGMRTTKEARFSFLLGGYVEDADVQGNDVIFKISSSVYDFMVIYQ